jgi:hypothetical protein
MLRVYKDFTNVFTISGHTLHKTSDSYIYCEFNRYVSVWGWATWKGKWKKYQSSSSLFNPIKRVDSIRSLNMYFFWKTIINDINSNILNTWDYQLSIYSYNNNLINITPSSSLTCNIGNINNTHSLGEPMFYIDNRDDLLEIDLTEIPTIDRSEFFEIYIYKVKIYYFIKSIGVIIKRKVYAFIHN